jgi:putative transposase
MHWALYNAAVINRRTQYQRFGHSVDYWEQQNSLPAFKQVWPEYAELGSQALQATLKRVDFAFQRFFKLKSGYPRLKRLREYRGWTYPATSGWKALTDGHHGQLALSNLGVIRMRGQARTWGTPSTCTVFFDQGKWYASLTVQCQPERELGLGIVGADFGCKTAVALSSGETITAPKFLAKAQEQLNKLSKRQRRKRKPQKQKVKASRRWKKLQSQIRRVKRNVKHQRQNWVHQVAIDITRRHSIIVTEKINLSGMTRKAKTGKRRLQKTGLNRSLLDVGIGMLKDALEYKLAEGSGFLIDAPTRQLKPTQRCAQCWQLTPKTLADRVHVCANPDCGHQEDRDINSAQVCEIWFRSQELASLVAESPSSTSCGSMKQLGALKRQKLHLLEVG